MKKITKETYLDWYKNMQLWRKFEDGCRSMYLKQKIRGFLHLYNGQEAIPAGITHILNPDLDNVITAYRCHVFPIAMGLDPKIVMAELFGKATGSSKGMGGSMHIFSKEHRFYGGHGIVGGQIPLGAGIAFADKYHKRKAVTFCLMGDGAVRQGAFHETLNMAMNWKLPVVFCCENNQYAMGTSVKRTANHEDLYKLGLGYDMPSFVVDGMNPQAVAEASFEAAERARNGEGPTFLEYRTYRFRGHSVSDAQSYRTKDEVKAKKEEDPLLWVENEILNKKWATKEELLEITNQMKAEVQECIKFADESPFPDPSQMYDMVYEQKEYPFVDKIENKTK